MSPCIHLYTLGTKPLPFEAWIRPVASLVIFFKGNNTAVFSFSVADDGRLVHQLYKGSTGSGIPTNLLLYSTGKVTFEEWNHVALVFNGSSSYKFFIGGSLSGTGASSLTVNGYEQFLTAINVGRYFYVTNNTFSNGHLSHLNVSKNILYTSNFTPSLPTT
jgi:hypothetical protein